MLADQFTAAAERARTLAQLEDLSRLLWRANAEGRVDDGRAGAISEAVEARRARIKAGRPASLPSRSTARRKPPRSPNRQASLDRRRSQAASGAMPPAIASRFTLGEQAALAVIARQPGRFASEVVEDNEANNLIAHVADVTKEVAPSFTCYDPTDKATCQTIRGADVDGGHVSFIKFANETVWACFRPDNAQYAMCGSEGVLYGQIVVSGRLEDAPKDDPRCKGFGDNLSADYLACEAALPPKG
jgi:hypothetical protein